MAQGDSWADPIIIGEDATTMAEVWQDFLDKKSNGSGKYMRFKDVNIEDGDFVINGSGTASDPFQVSTFNAMLHATGAPFIYQCKLINYNEEDPLAVRTYVYHDEENDVYKYCAFNPRPTTIDFNDIADGNQDADGYRDYLYITNKIDFNGWTLLNLKLITDFNYGAILCIYNSANDLSYIRDLVLLNCQIKLSDSRAFLSARFDDSILHIDVANASGSNPFGFIYSDSSSTRHFYRCALKLSVTAPERIMQGGFSGQTRFYDSKVDIDLDVKDAACAYAARLILAYNTVITGKTKLRTTSHGNVFPLFCALYDSIYDVEDNDINIDPSDYPMPYDNQRSVFNKSKNSWWTDTTGLTGVTSLELLSPSTLRSKGLLIGVDTNE